MHDQPVDPNEQGFMDLPMYTNLRKKFVKVHIEQLDQIRFAKSPFYF